MANLIIGLFVIWRIGLFAVASIGEKVFPFTPRFPYSDVYLVPSGLPNWIWSFANFDGVHYLTIAQKGYSAQFTQVFFPFYPLIINFAHKLLPIVDPIIVGLLLANIFFLLSLFMFNKLLTLDYKQDMIKWVLLFLVIFPTSFFFGSLYTEGIFLFLVLASFYAARKKQWLLSTIFGSIAGATRLIGIFLLPALMVEWYEEKLKSQKSKVKIVFDFFRSSLPLIPVGLLSYMLYLQIQFGDFLYFWHVQPVFGAERAGSGIVLLPQVIWRYFKILTNVSWQTEVFWISVLELLSTTGAIILLIIGYFRKIRLSYLVFALFAVLTPTLTGTFSSMPRYILPLFPIFIVLGGSKNTLLKMVMLLLFGFSLAILTILFTRGHWVG